MVEQCLPLPQSALLDPREERHRIYRRWLADIARVNPDLLLYGNDVDNLDVGGTRIRDHHPAGSADTADTADTAERTTAGARSAG